MGSKLEFLSRFYLAKDADQKKRIIKTLGGIGAAIALIASAGTTNSAITQANSYSSNSQSSNAVVSIVDAKNVLLNDNYAEQGSTEDFCDGLNDMLDGIISAMKKNEEVAGLIEDANRDFGAIGKYEEESRAFAQMIHQSDNISKALNASLDPLGYKLDKEFIAEFINYVDTGEYFTSEGKSDYAKHQHDRKITSIKHDLIAADLEHTFEDEENSKRSFAYLIKAYAKRVPNIDDKLIVSNFKEALKRANQVALGEEAERRLEEGLPALTEEEKKNLRLKYNDVVDKFPKKLLTDVFTSAIYNISEQTKLLNSDKELTTDKVIRSEITSEEFLNLNRDKLEVESRIMVSEDKKTQALNALDEMKKELDELESSNADKYKDYSKRKINRMKRELKNDIKNQEVVTDGIVAENDAIINKYSARLERIENDELGGFMAVPTKQVFEEIAKSEGISSEELEQRYTMNPETLNRNILKNIELHPETKYIKIEGNKEYNQNDPNLAVNNKEIMDNTSDALKAAYIRNNYTTEEVENLNKYVGMLMGRTENEEEIYDDIEATMQDSAESSTNYFMEDLDDGLNNDNVAEEVELISDQYINNVSLDGRFDFANNEQATKRLFDAIYAVDEFEDEEEFDDEFSNDLDSRIDFGDSGILEEDDEYSL